MKIAKNLFAGSMVVASALSGVDHAQAQQQPVKNIVLVHGAFADGTSWGKVIPILEARGFHVVAVQNPLTSLSDDVNATRRIIALQRRQYRLTKVSRTAAKRCGSQASFKPNPENVVWIEFQARWICVM